MKHETKNNLFVLIALGILVAGFFVIKDVDSSTGAAIELNTILSPPTIEDGLVINDFAYDIDKNELQVVANKEVRSENNQDLIKYTFKNGVTPRNLQLVLKSTLGEYTKINEFSTTSNFITKTNKVLFYSGNNYYSLDLSNIEKMFGGVSISFNADSKLLTIASHKISFHPSQQINVEIRGGLNE
ncbi:hypothetical protein HN592_06180 [Candidatus Woesearchaeota archaeon]|jgi:hypothetical protein|nr:hypothetical protein [Candidatus Woesearchaeota archaeon]MBT3304842.1 hypothetical protein [Candidatus Woesearchaeota archaeon]MBT4367822.1 hypothetical protein [Candidatus Woesearchaeota archaeon]MBT4712310.1 hypothetical protein [Candidatus Woesearchaeota archaeon]MBT6639222.1 hypothetical protein [Candidatus Woesearchaeota archaeon]